MELIRLKKRLVVARRGHRLLKDKQDQLLQVFMETIEKARRLREEIRQRLREASLNFKKALLATPRKEIERILRLLPVSTHFEIGYRQVLNLRVPEFTVKLEGTPYAFPVLGTSSGLEKALESYVNILPLILELAQLEKLQGMLAAEIEKTRRRVNALEYILIPAIEATIKYISAKLEELERGNIIRLMKIKELREK